MNMNDDLDEDGYPTEFALGKIRDWDIMDSKGWFDYIFSIWNFESYRWTEDGEDEIHKKPVTKYYLSTGGWSGNESIIGAMQENRMLWFLTWVQSNRGGHYVFYIRKELQKEET